MRSFMLGAINTGQADAATRRLTTSSHRPAAALADEVHRRRGHEQEVGLLGQLDVLGVGGVDLVPDAGVDRPLREGLEGEGRDELGGGVGHGDGDAAAVLNELTDDVADLVASDPAADADDDLFAGQR